VTRVEEAIYQLKRELIQYARPDDWELKGRDLRRGDGLFRALTWDQRILVIKRVANTLRDLPCQSLAVAVDKRALSTEYIASDDQLYRLALTRLLQEAEIQLDSHNETGLLLLDTRSSQHSSLQDRRVLDAYRDWVSERGNRTRFIAPPWFGFSAFYSALQIADFMAYLIDYKANEATKRGSRPLTEAYTLLEPQIQLFHIPEKRKTARPPWR
jgi:hypothetical protein